MDSLTIIIPVYRGAQSIALLAEELARVLPELTDQYEVIMVEDDGGDNSWEVIQQLAGRYSWLRGIKMMRNYGQHAALLCGIRAARHAVIITMDDDLQHPPQEIRHLLMKLNEGYDVVYGTPRDKQHSGGRNLGSVAIRYALSSAMGVSAARHASAFRAFRTHLRAAFAEYHSPYVALDVLLTWGTTRFGHVEVDHKPRAVGRSTYTLRKLIAHAMTMMTGFSVVPLRIASYLGFSLTLFGLLLLIYIVPVRALLGFEGVPGFTFLGSVIAIFSGAQMFTIGIIGEYIARVHFRLMDKPTYVVFAETAGASHDE